ncbi:MAG: retropepsin-like aspartic protease family protein [Beijerinckiaceae bacterium]
MIYLVIIIFAAGAIIAIAATISGSSSVLGLEVDRTLQIFGAVLMGCLLLGGAIGRSRGEMRENLKMAGYWVAIALVVVAGYAYRFELAAAGNRVAGAIVPGLMLFGPGGEVTASRDSGGHFAFDAKANGRPIRIMFDTGASSVVLKAEDAAAIGIRPDELSYSVNVRTANGVTQAAPITLRTLEIGGIREENVRAMVARPGQLFENLLGMSFLERLSSYEVRGDQLVLRGRGQ